MQMLRQDHRHLTNTLYHRSSNQLSKQTQPVSIKIAKIKTFLNYTPSYKKSWLTKQKVLEMIHRNGEESYAKLPKLLGALQSCVPGTVVAAQTKSV